MEAGGFTAWQGTSEQLGAVRFPACSRAKGSHCYCPHPGHHLLVPPAGPRQGFVVPVPHKGAGGKVWGWGAQPLGHDCRSGRMTKSTRQREKAGKPPHIKAQCTTNLQSPDFFAIKLSSRLVEASDFVQPPPGEMEVTSRRRSQETSGPLGVPEREAPAGPGLLGGGRPGEATEPPAGVRPVLRRHLGRRRGRRWGQVGPARSAPLLPPRCLPRSGAAPEPLGGRPFAMKKHHSVQGTFSRLFGKKHGAAAATTTSLFATNPPWIFTQEVTSDSAGGTGQCPWRGELGKGEDAGGTGGRRRPRPFELRPSGRLREAPARPLGAAPAPRRCGAGRCGAGRGVRSGVQGVRKGAERPPPSAARCWLPSCPSEGSPGEASGGRRAAGVYLRSPWV